MSELETNGPTDVTEPEDAADAAAELVVADAADEQTTEETATTNV
ncbi:hypothetical protein LCGC14_2431610, partial [marine sediment metagenome]